MTNDEKWERARHRTMVEREHSRRTHHNFYENKNVLLISSRSRCRYGCFVVVCAHVKAIVASGTQEFPSKYYFSCVFGWWIAQMLKLWQHVPSYGPRSTGFVFVSDKWNKRRPIIPNAARSSVDVIACRVCMLEQSVCSSNCTHAISFWLRFVTCQRSICSPERHFALPKNTSNHFDSKYLYHPMLIDSSRCCWSSSISPSSFSEWWNDIV